MDRGSWGLQSMNHKELDVTEVTQQWQRTTHVFRAMA